MKNFYSTSKIMTAARQYAWSGCALTVVMFVGGCELKTANFFTPDTHAAVTPTLFDVDPPTFTNPSPRLLLPGPFNINAFQFDVNDVVGSNGVAASGVDWSKVTATRASSGLVLPLTHSGSQASGSLAGIDDGQLGINWTASDLRGNKSIISQSFFLKINGPLIGFTTTPLTTFSSNAVSTSFTLGGTITDAYLNSAVGTISKPGADNVCGTSDDVLWPIGTGGGQVSANSWTYALNAPFSLTFNAYNGVPTGGTPTTATYCIQVTAADKATDAVGNPKPNTSTKVFTSMLTWMPLLPVPGSVSGVVTINGVGASGITVTAGSQTVATNGSGTYRIDGLTPGVQSVTLGAIPINVTCTPQAKNVTILAGSVVNADFSCTQPLFGSVDGTVTTNGTGGGLGYTIGVGVQTVQTTSTGGFHFDGLPVGPNTLTMIGMPAGVTCTPSSLSVTVFATTLALANFVCTRIIAFTIAVTMSYRHLGETSEACAAIATSPAQPNAAYQGQISGPGVVGSGQLSGTLSPAGTATARFSINQFGPYAGVINVGAQSASFSINVVSTAGSCLP